MGRGSRRHPKHGGARVGPTSCPAEKPPEPKYPLVLNSPTSNVRPPQVASAGLRLSASPLTFMSYNMTRAKGVLINRDPSPPLSRARKSELSGLTAVMFP